MKRLNTISIAVCLALLGISNAGNAVPKACKGISEKCTKDKIYTKVINKKPYTCYDCSQTLCEGNAIVGTKKKSVCEEVPTSESSSKERARQLNNSPQKINVPKDKGKPGIRDKLTPKFDEADSIFGKRTSIKQEKDKGKKKTPTNKKGGGAKDPYEER